VEFLQEELKRREDVHVEENRRKDTIIAQLTQRIPELESPREASHEPREGPVTASEEGDKASTPLEQQEPSQHRSWWRAFFGLE